MTILNNLLQQRIKSQWCRPLTLEQTKQFRVLILLTFTCCLQRCINHLKSKLCKSKPEIIQGTEIKLSSIYSNPADNSIWCGNLLEWCQEALGNLWSDMTVQNASLWPPDAWGETRGSVGQIPITKQNHLFNSCHSRSDKKLYKLQNHLENMVFPPRFSNWNIC